VRFGVDTVQFQALKKRPNVMKHFKTNFQGKVDMGLVSKIARS